MHSQKIGAKVQPLTLYRSLPKNLDKLHRIGGIILVTDPLPII